MDAPVSVSPVRRAKGFPVSLARRSLWNFLPKLHRLGRLNASKFFLAVSEDSCLGQGFTIPEYDHGFDGFAPGIVRDADHRTFVNLRQRHDPGLDLRAINVE